METENSVVESQSDDNYSRSLVSFPIGAWITWASSCSEGAVVIWFIHPPMVFPGKAKKREEKSSLSMYFLIRHCCRCFLNGWLFCLEFKFAVDKKKRKQNEKKKMLHVLYAFRFTRIAQKNALCVCLFHQRKNETKNLSEKRDKRK